LFIYKINFKNKKINTLQNNNYNTTRKTQVLMDGGKKKEKEEEEEGATDVLFLFYQSKCEI
jgi:hypothetical protein